MRTVRRTGIAAGVGLILAGGVAAGPAGVAAPRGTVDTPVRLLNSSAVDTTDFYDPWIAGAVGTSGDSLFNIPLNLFFDFVNIPANELLAIDEFAKIQMFTGPWYDTDGVNLWGIDLGDVPRIEALINMLIPIPALSNPIGQNIAGLLAAEMPTNTACQVLNCTEAGTSALYGGYFQVPFGDLLKGYAFPGYGPTVEDYQPINGAMGIEGTHQVTDAAGHVVNVFPWAGDTFTLDVFKPITAFLASLTAPPEGLLLTPYFNVFTTFTDLITSFFVMFAQKPFPLEPYVPSWYGGPYVPAPGADTAVPAGAAEELGHLTAGIAAGETAGSAAGDVGSALPF